MPASLHAPAPRVDPAPSRVSRALSEGRWLDLAAVAVLAGSLAGFAGAWFWLFDLTTHFRWYWLVLSLAGLVGCLRWKRPTAVACLAIAAAANARDLLPYWLPPRAPAALASTAGLQAADDRRVFVISTNVHRVNDDATAALAYLRDRRPDVVAVLEVDDDWAAALEGLADLFPHRMIRPRTDNFGIALLSRWPLADAEIVAFSSAGFPSVVATICRPAGDFRFIATHPYPPFNARCTEELTAHLDALGARVAAERLPCVVAGDFNAAPWSRPFQRLVAASGLVDSGLGRGVRPTWHAHLPAPRIPIDHVLVPAEATVLRREVGPDIGSDHYPVEAEILLP